MAFNNKINIVLDIETVGRPVSDEDVNRYIEEEYTAPANYKDPVAILRHREKFIGNARQELEKKAALRYDAQIVSVAFGEVTDNEVRNVKALCSPDDEAIAKFALDELSFSDKRIIGFNCRKFDLPRLSRLLRKYKLRPPFPVGKWDVIDLFQSPLEKISLKEAARQFGIKSPSNLDGSAVGPLFLAEQYKEIEEYNKSDVIITGELYLALTYIHAL